MNGARNENVCLSCLKRVRSVLEMSTILSLYSGDSILGNHLANSFYIFKISFKSVYSTRTNGFSDLLDKKTSVIQNHTVSQCICGWGFRTTWPRVIFCIIPAPLEFSGPFLHSSSANRYQVFLDFFRCHTFLLQIPYDRLTLCSVHFEMHHTHHSLFYEFNQHKNEGRNLNY